MLVLFLVPVPRSPITTARRLDKLVHFGLFLGFAVLYRLDRRAGFIRVVLVSALFAGAVELAQELTGYRSGELMDFVAGTVGALVGAALTLALPRNPTGREP